MIPCFQENPLSFRLYETVPQTDTGGRDENSKALKHKVVFEGLLLIVHMRILMESTKDGIPQHLFWSEPLLL